ncbi:hypothetical protein MF672_011610 [Actinomadura sp. ATCC 31491]|uniref:Uncharacterized protein n=1 Tax=Actinomadura luzonensis TaxID=2805427 RepID=A0ABT0FQ41_9ACTN|nr:hypothetical protein [Actinomadura luzonensis]MCK2214432.1 hypothetical protein [Actinomadura luzonensis]
MRSMTANEESRLLFWRRVREFAVPPSMIERAAARRAVGDWAGACAAARVDVDLHPRSAARAHGHEMAARLRDDLRHLAPDLLRWHLPRIAPDGLLRPGLTVPLARYLPGVWLVARTPPARAAGGQRISVALWDGGAAAHPHPRPHRCFRLDLHRHLWDVRRAGELRERAGNVDDGRGWAVDRWAAEARLLLRAEGRDDDGPVAVRLGGRRRLVLEPAGEGTAGGGPIDGGPIGGGPAVRVTAVRGGRGTAGVPVLPDAATWALPDLALLRAGLIPVERLHPLVASVLAPGHPAGGTPGDAGEPWTVECRGERHRLGLVDGVLVPLDHDPGEVRREELLAALGGVPMPCLRVIHEAHRDPAALDDVRARLRHGDVDGALAAVERLLGPGASVPGGRLRDELEAAARRRVAHGLFRAGLDDAGQGPRAVRRSPERVPGRGRPRHAMSR